MTVVTSLMRDIANLIINPLIILGFVIATIYLFYGIVQMIWGAEDGKWDEKKKNVMYGILGLFIMFSVYGILHLVMNTFGIQCRVFFC